MLPNFLVIGAEKAGTTWLYDTLKQHPDIFLPDTKELSYFNRLDSNLKPSDYFVTLPLKWYEDFFSDRAHEHATGDISPMYICDTEAPARIAKTLPNAKLIAILRDPIERAASQYWMAKNKRHISASLEEVVASRHPAIIQRGLYADQIKRYMDFFSRSQLLVLIFEEVMSDRNSAIEKICGFIGVDPERLSRDRLDIAVNAAAAYKWPWIYNASVTAATALRKMRFLSWVPRLLKKTGLNEYVKVINAREFEKPLLNENLKADLCAYYAEDRIRLEAFLGRRIECWTRHSENQ